MSITIRQTEISRKKLKTGLKSLLWEKIMMFIIILNALILGLQTSQTINASWGTLLTILDFIILGIFVAELLARFYAFGKEFWKDPWSIFDFVVVAISLVPASESMSILRSLRILRVLRLISTIKSMRKVVTGLLAALPGMGSVIALMAIIFYVFAVMATNLFHDAAPDKFGSLGASTFTLFQVMTLESWAEGVVRPILAIHPLAWLFFIPFILLTSFAILNLFIGIMVDAMQSSATSDVMELERSQHEESMEMEKSQHKETQTALTEVMKELREIRQELEQLKARK